MLRFKKMNKNAVLVAIAAFIFLASVPAAVLADFTRPLSVGSNGEDVAQLQQFLKDEGFFTYPVVTGYFGEATKEALAKYQSFIGLEAVGRVGPKTLAFLNQNSSTLVPVISTSTATSSILFSSTLSLGSAGEEVKNLQSFLKTFGFFSYPSITGYFGEVTKAAVVAFQKAYSISPIGIVGPLTQAKIYSLLISSQSPSTSPTTAPSTSIPSSTSATEELETPTNIHLSATSKRVVVSWASVENATSYNIKRKTKGEETFVTIGTSTTSSYTDEEVAGGKTYIYIISAENKESESAFSNETDVYVPRATVGGDSIAPTLSSIASSTSLTTATITWTTDENADSRVDYGSTTSYGTASSSATLATSHSIVVSGLTDNTLYHFRIQSTDAQGNAATSNDYTFTTATLLSSGQLSTLARLETAADAALVSNPVDNATMASPPTITAATTTDATLTVKKYPAVNPELFRISGGKLWRRTVNNRLYITTNTVASSTSGSLKTSFPTAGQMSPEVPSTGYDNANNWEVTFVTSSDVVEIEFQPSTATNPYRFIVDGQYVARDGQQVTATGNQFVKLTFASATSRTITLEAQGGHLIGGVTVKTGYTVTAPTGTTVKAVVTGDSFTEALNQGTYSGTTKFWQWDGLANVFARKAGITWMRNAAVGGTGYWNQSGGVPGTRSNIYNQEDYWISDDTYDAILFAGGYNDAGQTSDANLRILARAAWEKARTAQPNALIMVAGIWGGRTLSSDSSVRIPSEAALLAEFNSWADPFSMFIPVSPTYATAWMYGTGYEGATNGSGNSDLYVSTDGTHPNRSGHLYLGGKLNTAYRTYLSEF